MKILITGIDGYIGEIMADAMLQHPDLEIFGLDTGFYASRSFYEHSILKSNIPVIRKDIRQITIDDLKGVQAVIHLAELSNDPLGSRFSEATFDINHKGTIRLATLAKKAGVERFIYSSSCSVYGASDEISNEESAVNPLTPYAKCKILNEQKLSALADDKFSPVYLRNATAFGASPSMRFDLAINNLTGLAWTIKEIKMDSDGTSWRPFVHIKDIAFAALCCLRAPKSAIHNQIFNVGDNRSNYQIKDIAQIISVEMPDCQITFSKDNIDKRNYRVDFAKINTKLPGFKISMTVADGIRELLDIFRTVKMSKELFEASEFTRLSQVKYLLKTGQLDDMLNWKVKK